MPNGHGAEPEDNKQVLRTPTPLSSLQPKDPSWLCLILLLLVLLLVLLVLRLHLFCCSVSGSRVLPKKIWDGGCLGGSLPSSKLSCRCAPLGFLTPPCPFPLAPHFPSRVSPPLTSRYIKHKPPFLRFMSSCSREPLRLHDPQARRTKGPLSPLPAVVKQEAKEEDPGPVGARRQSARSSARVEAAQEAEGSKEPQEQEAPKAKGKAAKGIKRKGNAPKRSDATFPVPWLHGLAFSKVPPLHSPPPSAPSAPPHACPLHPPLFPVP